MKWIVVSMKNVWIFCLSEAELDCLLRGELVRVLPMRQHRHSQVIITAPLTAQTTTSSHPSVAPTVWYSKLGMKCCWVISINMAPKLMFDRFEDGSGFVFWFQILSLLGSIAGLCVGQLRATISGPIIKNHRCTTTKVDKVTWENSTFGVWKSF